MVKWQLATSISHGFTVGGWHSVSVLFEFGAIPQLISMTHMANVFLRLLFSNIFSR